VPVAIAGAGAALLSGACFWMTSSAFRPLGGAPIPIRSATARCSAWPSWSSPPSRGEAAPDEGRGAALNTFGLGADAAQLLGPWGLGLTADTWGLGGAIAVAGVVSLLGAAAYRRRPRPGQPSS